MIYWNEYNYDNIINYTKVDGCKTKKHNSIPTTYSNTIYTFDCESTSYFITPDNEIIVFDSLLDNDYYRDCIKRGLMYIWMIGINEDIIYGRTYIELRECLIKIKEKFEGRIIVYIHNLAFDFNFILNSALDDEWEVFARNTHKIIYAINKTLDIEFRCSYQLTGKSLADFCEDYKLPYRKKVNDLQYNVLRTPLTELDEIEYEYCEYDIRCLYEIIKYFKNKYKHITNIPLTKTGIVRKPITKYFYNNTNYHNLIKENSPKNFDELKVITDAYFGGYTHANHINTEKVLENILSYDITSSYPYSCCTMKMPCTSFVKWKYGLDRIDREKQCFIIDVTFGKISTKTNNTFLSKSKYIYKDPITGEACPPKKCVFDNGKIVSAENIRYRLTDLDYDLVLKTYDVKDIKINELYVAEKDYLPYFFIDYILKLYKDKTQYKGIEDKIGLYHDSKSGCNSIYGMMVTKDIMDDVICKPNAEELWSIKEKSRDEITNIILSDLVNDKKKPNTLYSWGVWVAAWSRTHLWDIILQLGDNLVYTDTDSVKFKYFEGYEKIFEEDNKKVLENVKKICKRYEFKGLTEDDFKPKDIEGKEHQLGFFDKERTYKRFITIGAKKYAYQYDDDEIHITLAGVSKKDGPKALSSLDEFKTGKLFDYDTCGKLEVYYIEKQLNTVMPDGYIDDTKYGICLKPTVYTLKSSIEDFELLTDAVGLSAL